MLGTLLLQQAKNFWYIACYKFIHLLTSRNTTVVNTLVFIIHILLTIASFVIIIDPAQHTQLLVTLTFCTIAAGMLHCSISCESTVLLMVIYNTD